jgi:hypothetical protein
MFRDVALIDRLVMTFFYVHEIMMLIMFLVNEKKNNKKTDMSKSVTTSQTLCRNIRKLQL